MEDDAEGPPQTPDFARTVPAGDTIERAVCRTCGFVAYENPKIVAGAVVRHDGRLLMCRRAIEPRRGFWTIPAGYLELRETPAEAAVREAREEALADIRLGPLLAVYTIARLSQVQLIYRAELSGSFGAGEESLEVRLFAPGEIPWEEIAFPSVVWALEHDRRVAAGEEAPPFENPARADGDLARFVRGLGGAS